MVPEKRPHRRAHPEQIRRTKQWLRFMPRRAMFHKYPFVGRFAGMMRKRAYLWSFKPIHLRPAFYSGSILALLPLLGVQLPLALALAVLLRANFMVLGGLQFITNPVSAPAIYLVTHKLGSTVIAHSGIGRSLDLTENPPYAPVISEEEVISPTPLPPASPAAQRHWSRRLGSALNSMIIGGVILGSLMGLVLDLLHRLYWRASHHHHGPHHPPHSKPPVK